MSVITPKVNNRNRISINETEPKTKKKRTSIVSNNQSDMNTNSSKMQRAYFVIPLPESKKSKKKSINKTERKEKKMWTPKASAKQLGLTANSSKEQSVQTTESQRIE